MKRCVQLASVGMLVAAATFGVPHIAMAQNTDDAHALCAQGGGPDANSGAGGSGSDTGAGGGSGGGASGSDTAGGVGGGIGGGGGLGGSADGGGAGGCGPVQTPTPVVIVTRVERLPINRLPITGSAADRFGFGGSALLILGGGLVAVTRRARRREAAATAGLEWDVFGGRSG